MKMESHTTTRPPAGTSERPPTKPLGGRKLTNQHATAEWCAQRFRPKPDFDRFEAVQILEEIGSQLPGEWRMTPQLIAHLRLLVRMTMPRDWHDGTPVVWMSVKKTADLLGITPAQVNRNENRLMALMLITFRDSANHKRFGTRCPESKRITTANGIDLSPVGARLHYLRQMRKAIIETRSRKAEYRQLITRLRRRIRGIFVGIEDGSWTGPEGVDVLADEFEALLAGIKTGRVVPVEELKTYVGALQAFCSRLEAGEGEALEAAEIHENEQNMRPRDHHHATPGPHRCDAHTVQRSSMNPITGSRVAANPHEAGAPPDASPGNLYGHQGDGSGREAGASSPPALPPLMEDITARLRLSRLTPRLPREMTDHENVTTTLTVKLIVTGPGAQCVVTSVPYDDAHVLCPPVEECPVEECPVEECEAYANVTSHIPLRPEGSNMFW